MTTPRLDIVDDPEFPRGLKSTINVEKMLEDHLDSEISAVQNQIHDSVKELRENMTRLVRLQVLQQIVEDD